MPARQSLARAIAAVAAWSRSRRQIGRLIAVVLAVGVAAEAVWIALTVIAPDPIWDFGMDYRFYVGLGERWLTDGAFYQARQLSGPYEVEFLTLAGTGDTLYPPPALFLFVPLAFLPAAAWWLFPLGVTAFALSRLRPSPWAWVVMLLLLAWPRAIGAYLFGNTDIWMVAGVAGGLVWGWPALALVMKPSLAPLALLGVRRRSWQVGALLGLATIILAAPLWLDYVVAMRNASGLSLGYSLGSLPLLLIPVIGRLLPESGPDGVQAHG